MLVLSRKIGEEIIIGDNIRVMVVAVRGNQVRLGFSAPGEVNIHRAELRDADAREARPDLCLTR
jgi:carbon storage regulator